MSDAPIAVSVDDDIVARYEAIRDYGRVMQRYAEASDWDNLVTLQLRYVEAFEALADVEEDVMLSPAADEQKAALLLEIQYAQDLVRDCLQKRLGELGDVMGTARQRRTAVKSYQAQRSA